MLKLLKYFKKRDWAWLSVSVVLIVAQVWLDLKLPEYMSKITFIIKTPGSSMSEVWTNGVLMFLCAVGSLISAVAVGYIVAKIAAAFSEKIRGLLFEKVDSFATEEINKFSTASLITRTTNDVTQVQTFITMGLQMLVKAPILAIWAVVKISGKGIEWSYATGVALGLMLIVCVIIIVFVIPKFKKMQTLTDNINRVTRENLQGVRVVRAYNAEDYQEEKFEKANDELTKASLFTSRGMSIISPFMTMLMSGLSLAIYWIGAYLIDRAGLIDKLLVYSDMVVFSSYSMQIFMAFMMLIMVFILLPRALVSANRINEVINTKPSIVSGNVTEGMEGLKGDIQFKNVGFKYPGASEYVLKDINFEVKQGETVAFIGSTGSGKSTLINLVVRLFDATEGEILIDGINVKDYKLSSLNNLMGYVSQKAVMFKGTIKSNVTYGVDEENEHLQENMANAVKIAQAKEFVEKLENTYDSEVAQAGTNLSGGQKQRLSIARAINKHPEIFIFDDSFSALDYKTDRTLRSVLKKEIGDATKLIVAQRLGTIMDSDKIVVLDKGQIVGIGTHKQLLKECVVYKEIALSQLSEEELA